MAPPLPPPPLGVLEAVGEGEFLGAENLVAKGDSTWTIPDPKPEVGVALEEEAGLIGRRLGGGGPRNIRIPDI